jgi:hypothetical protein
LNFIWIDVVLFRSSAIRYAISKSCFHAVAAVETEASSLASKSYKSSGGRKFRDAARAVVVAEMLQAPAAPQDVTSFSSVGVAPYISTNAVLEASPRLWSLLLLSLPLLHARALLGELGGAANDFGTASNLLRSNKLPRSFKKQFNEAVSKLFQFKNRSYSVGEGIEALGHFQRFFRFRCIFCLLQLYLVATSNKYQGSRSMSSSIHSLFLQVFYFLSGCSFFFFFFFDFFEVRRQLRSDL